MFLHVSVKERRISTFTPPFWAFFRKLIRPFLPPLYARGGGGFDDKFDQIIQILLKKPAATLEEFVAKLQNALQGVEYGKFDVVTPPRHMRGIKTA